MGDSAGRFRIATRIVFFNFTYHTRRNRPSKRAPFVMSAIQLRHSYVVLPANTRRVSRVFLALLAAAVLRPEDQES